MADVRKLLLLYDRPLEPSFVPKGERKEAFEVPTNYLTNRYQSIGIALQNRFGSEANETIAVTEVPPPDLGDILDLGRYDNFSLFIPKHIKLAAKLTTIFLRAKNTDELLSLAIYARDRVNPYLFNYSFSVALLHRPDTKNLDIPNFLQSFPDKYFDSKVFIAAREQSFVRTPQERQPIEIPRDFTASDLEEEHRLAYWREDLALNLHHWHWHLVYPTDGADEVVNKNRRGELFFYSHQQIVSRYNFERLCNKLRRVERLVDWKAPIKEAYFPKLDSLIASRAWPGRVANSVMQDLKRPQEDIRIDIDTMIRWRDRIYDAIHKGYVEGPRNERIELTEFEGIDILGNILEASQLSPNSTFYGNLHALGHLVLSYIHDPESKHLERFGVIGDFATAMRDPIFYRWHAFVDDVFQEFKDTLPRYTVEQLNNPGVTVSKVTVQSQTGSSNEIRTFWQQSDVDLSRGMDFTPRGSVLVRFTHLQHEPFVYNITVNNESGQNKQGTCRIFLAPKVDEKGTPWLYKDQKHMFIELDKFTVNLKQGQNNISKNSSESSVTIPFSRSFRNLDLSRPVEADALAQFNFCGCGWPDNLLIPKGTPEGFICELFVMISNIEGDRINQDTSGACNDAASYCGIRDKLYPDRRSMGYPFDRLPRPGVNTLQQFLTPNMRVQDVRIIYTDRTVRPVTASGN